MSLDFERTLFNAIRTQTPLLVSGEPGIGKTAHIKQFLGSHKVTTDVVMVSLRDQSDMLGWPIPSKDNMKIGDVEIKVLTYAPPQFAVRAAQAKTPHVIFLDELSCATPTQQAFALRIVHERVVGELELDPKTVGIVAACNPTQLAAGGYDLTAPMGNRFKHHTYKLDSDWWANNFTSYWGNPPVVQFGNWILKEFHWAQARALWAGFIKVAKDKLLVLPKSETERGGAWASPRTIDFASRHLGIYIQEKLRILNSLPDIQECVGAIAPEFMEWVKKADLPDPEEVLQDPVKFHIPDRGDIVYTLLCSVCAAVLNRISSERWDAIWIVIDRVADKHGKDIASVAVKDLCKFWITKFSANRGGELIKELGNPSTKTKKFSEFFKLAGLLS